MALLDLLGRKMALRVIWELSKSDLRFRPLQEAADTNPAVLNTRLTELKEARLVSLGPDGYSLTALGRELARQLLDLTEIADRWSSELAEGR
jgi:DNA-binding HxlR family transcriptional regulator